MEYINITFDQKAILAILDILFGKGLDQDTYKLDVAILKLFRLGLNDDLNKVLSGDLITAEVLRKRGDQYPAYNSNLILALGKRHQSVEIKSETNIILTYLLRSENAFRLVSQQLGKIPKKDFDMVQPVLRETIMHNHHIRARYFVQDLGLFASKVHPAAMEYASGIYTEAIQHNKKSKADFSFPQRKPLKYLDAAALVPNWKPVDLAQLCKDSLRFPLKPCLYTLDGRLQAMQHVINHLESSMIKYLTQSNQVLQY